MLNRIILKTAFTFFLVFLFGIAGCQKQLKQGTSKKISVIYSSDLYHQPGDPDDQFDLASIFAIDELDVKVIILDNTIPEANLDGRETGIVPVAQMNYITGRNVPYAIGLPEKLKTPDDDCLWQPKQFQTGVENIITILEKSDTPVKIVTVGSLRDVAAAYNRRPDLFRKKVDSIMMFIGDAANTHLEYNVKLDINAWSRLINAHLPIYWVPCFDGGLFKNNGNASHWKAAHADLLKYASDKVMNYFIYALLSKNDPRFIQFIDNPVNAEDKAKVLSNQRDLFCTAVFTFLADRKVVRKGDEYFSIPASAELNGLKQIKVFDFKPVSVFAQPDGCITFGKTKQSSDIMLFDILDKNLYPKVMTSVTANLIKDLQ